MDTQHFEPDPSRTFIRRLQALLPSARSGFNSHARHLFSYCAFDRERIASVRMKHPSILVVLQGCKEVWVGGRAQAFGPGAVFVLPPDLDMEVINIPGDDGQCLYEAMIMEVPALPAGIAPVVEAAAPVLDFGVKPGSDLMEALIHAATVIADHGQSEVLKALRMAEVLTLMRPYPAARCLFHVGLADQVAWLIASQPSRAWTVPDVAGRLGLGASTLRRQLAAAGTSFRAIVARERLRAGRDAIQSGALSIAAAEAAGYASRSHFARRYREHFGTTPTGR
ncbi:MULTISPECIES: helix-turn-helix domain-containing protein [Asticcacaulis]|uniref:helix-turn-helix transcriptional regulator n=1 Tax=Asticcacaulis TaxID=76890 RepID=UPI001AE21503|nr:MULTISPECIES: helix-turn-helix domain-containing protein [Asticcacaulis]MBP2158135.1 AraC-like DNA-binding protein [Asticcacaulis solisilvae]MDR6799180.1 AraC-like DNA-binding protein [Asticcacaulis sp. BE141]